MAGLAECELGLGFEATGTLGGRGLGAYMSVHNNGPLDPVDQWLVAWTLPNDRLEAGTVDGVILVSAGVNGAPLRVVNTDSNAQIPVGGSKSFSFRMDSLQSSSEGLSRAPSDLSVNGKVCRPADGRASADLCVAPAVLPTLSNASSSSGGGRICWLLRGILLREAPRGRPQLRAGGGAAFPCLHVGPLRHSRFHIAVPAPSREFIHPSPPCDGAAQRGLQPVRCAGQPPRTHGPGGDFVLRYPPGRSLDGPG